MITIPNQRERRRRKKIEAKERHRQWGAYTRERDALTYAIAFNQQLVRDNFVPDNLIDICKRSERGFESFGKSVEVPMIWRGQPVEDHFYIYQDNGASVLGIAHLDTVAGISECVITGVAGEPIVFSPALDDRLGAWVITDLLPRCGLNIDWLLTTGEETMSSTGEDWVEHHLAANGKPYNWMFQFDRTGTDVVLYQYDEPELRRKLTGVGMRPARGSFSDISTMENLGCSGFNVGVGYEDYHSKRSHAWLNDTFDQVAHFIEFYNRYHATPMPHEKLAFVDEDDLEDAAWFGANRIEKDEFLRENGFALTNEPVGTSKFIQRELADYGEKGFGG